MHRCLVLQTLYFSLPIVVLYAFSVLCTYSKFRHHPHPLGYLCANFRVLCGLHCRASHAEKLAYSLTQLTWCPGNRALWNKPLEINTAQQTWPQTCITLRGSRLLTAAVDIEPAFDMLGYSELWVDCCDLDFFSASCNDNAIAANTHTRAHIQTHRQTDRHHRLFLIHKRHAQLKWT